MIPLSWRPCLLAAALAMAGCSSAPVRYYTLSAPAGSVVQVAAAAPYLIELLPVGIPESLDRQGLVVRAGQSQVSVLDRERWAGPLADELHGALSQQLSAQLGSRDIAGLARPTDQKVLRIKIDVRRLDAWLGQRVDLAADWSLGWADQPAQRQVCSTRLSVPAPGDAEALVAAYQQALAQLAGQVAQASRAAPSTGCP